MDESIPGKDQHHTKHRKFVWLFPGMLYGYLFLCNSLAENL